MDFRNTLMILTSNLGSDALSRLPEGAAAKQAEGAVMAAVRAHFRPEFLNRLDEIVLFDRLSRADMTGIVEIQLGLLEKRLAGRKIGLALDDAARRWLGDKGYDPVYGARPLKRVIQKALQDPLAEMILSGGVKDGERVEVTAGEDGLVIGGAIRPLPGAEQGPQPATLH